MFIDNSSMEYLVTCARSAEYALIRKRRLASQSSALFFGGAIHAALEYRYRNAGKLNPSEIQPGQMALLEILFAEAPHSFSDHRTLSFAMDLIAGYNQKYSREEFRLMQTEKGPIVEQAFAIELFRLNVPLWLRPDDILDKDGKVSIPKGVLVVIYTGRVDLLVEWDGVYVIDHKTSLIMGTGFFEEQAVSPQHKGYVWAVYKAYGIMPQGYCVNAICTREMSKSRPKVDDKDFIRAKTFVTKDLLEEWEYNLKQLITEYLWKYIRGYLPMEQKWCVHKYGRCQFYEVCSMIPSNRLEMLASGLYADNTWSPLTKAQEILAHKTPAELQALRPKPNVLIQDPSEAPKSVLDEVLL